jgi:hypothetical protein
MALGRSKIKEPGINKKADAGRRTSVGDLGRADHRPGTIGCPLTYSETMQVKNAATNKDLSQTSVRM